MNSKIKLNQWNDDLSECPSQCYYYFRDKAGQLKCLYLRWRHNDPWTAEIIPIDECGEFNYGEQWDNLNPPFFKDTELKQLKEWSLSRITNTK